MNTVRAFVLCLLGLPVLTWSNLLSAQDESKSDHILLIVGASGAPEFGEQFKQWAETWQQIAKNANANIDSIGLSSQSNETDRELCKLSIDRLAKESDSPLWIVMIGHGTFTRGVAKFNLRGPDISATEFAEWLMPLERPIMVINSASSSGPFINRLSGERRIIVTATKSGTEQNFARFGEYFARAIVADDADLDHDDEVSVLEAFLRASADVRSFYESEARIASEHALIDDNGDGKGTPPSMFRAARAVGESASGSPLDGAYASQITLSPILSRIQLTATQRSQRHEIEGELSSLRERKSQLDQASYDALIEPLMIRLAKIYRDAEQTDIDSEK